MRVQRRPLWHDAVHGIVQVGQYGRARVFVDREGRRGVHDEEIAQPDLDRAELGASG